MEPCHEYKVACCKTVFQHKLMMEDNPSRNITLEIYNACDEKKTGDFSYTITDEDVANI